MVDELNTNPYGLNDEQKEFCELYAVGSMRGHGTDCYVEAYEVDLTRQGAYASARAGASRLLTNDNILSYIRDLFEDKDLNDTVVDNELAFVIKQNADFGSKVAAIKEYNQLKARIIKKIEAKVENTGELIIQGQKFADKDADKT
jgi:hypothetical protein